MVGKKQAQKRSDFGKELIDEVLCGRLIGGLLFHELYRGIEEAESREERRERSALKWPEVFRNIEKL